MRAAVVALLAALAVLIHHETTAVALGSTPSAAVHVMTPGTMTARSHAAPPTAMSGQDHANGSRWPLNPAAGATPAVISTDGMACSGMAMDHCSSASLEVVKVPPPVQSHLSSGHGLSETVTAGPRAVGTAGRAPPDLSALSQLRI
ncbi:hypothetical protein [Streptomyces adustus]|uniref:hypothetical protein n=1 Tax=Streptomyces adustus TaxID=1609272 RepID=UPI003723F0E9